MEKVQLAITAYLDGDVEMFYILMGKWLASYYQWNGRIQPDTALDIPVQFADYLIECNGDCQEIDLYNQKSSFTIDLSTLG